MKKIAILLILIYLIFCIQGCGYKVSFGYEDIADNTCKVCGNPAEYKVTQGCSSAYYCKEHKDELINDEPTDGNHTKDSSDKDSFGHDKFDAITIAEKEVKKQLKSPSTAKFCKTSEYTVTVNKNKWTVSGWVDAQNSFGATLRNTFTVTITFTSVKEYNASCSIHQ